jgi:hypothetical protein
VTPHNENQILVAAGITATNYSDTAVGFGGKDTGAGWDREDSSRRPANSGKRAKTRSAATE